jgi:periplasmic protein TonB
MSEQAQGLPNQLDPLLVNQERHLQQLLPFEGQKLWALAFFDEVRDYFFPKQQPPLRITSRPIPPVAIRAGILVYHGAFTPQPTGPVQMASSYKPGVVVDSAHLGRFSKIGDQLPIWTAAYYNVRDYFFPPKLPPLQVTSRPVQVKSIWGMTAGKGQHSALYSGVAHVTVIALMFILGSSAIQEDEVKDTVTLIAPDIDIAPYMPKLKPKPQQMGGGGGGGDRSPTPASKGKLPPVATKQFVPPAAVVHNPNPRLVMQPTILVPHEAADMLPDVDIMAWGDPLGVAGPPSNGPGSGGGIGSGSGGGVGPGKGGGYGPGEGGGVGGGVYRIGGGVSAPTLIYKVEPEYSEEARKAKYQGTVVLYVVVDEKGMPKELKVVRALGLGLDEKAIAAVQKWRFRPGYLNGKPVKVAATIEVNFRLL